MKLERGVSRIRASGPSFRDASHRTYRVFFSVVFISMAVRCAVIPLGRMADLTDLLATDVGPWNVLPPLTSPALAETLRWVAVAACLVAATRIRPAFTATLACLLVVAQAAFLRGFAHVNHTEMGAITVMLALTLSTWADAIDRASAFADPTRGGQAFFTAGLMFALTYSMAALVRVVNGGWDIVMSDSVKFWAMRNAMVDSAVNNAVRDVGWAVVHTPIASLLEIGFLVVTLLELLAPLYLVSRAFRRLFLASMLLFHLVSGVVLGVLFTDSLVILVLFALADLVWLPRDAARTPL